MPARPLVTFAVFAYNQADIVAHAVRGALAQTYTPLQIILSDDCSRDDTFAVMQALANDPERTDPHAVILNRNPRNLGIGAHVNRVMELAEGELIVAAAGDDISRPQRTAVLVEQWLRSGKQARSLHSAVMRMDINGAHLDVLRHLVPGRLNDVRDVARNGIGLLGASHAWAREVFDKFGPLLPCVVREDIVIPFRSAMLGPIVYINEPLVDWRVGLSTWHSMHETSAEVEEMRKRSRFHLRLGHIDAVQAYADATLHDDPAITQLVYTRLAERLLLRQISNNERIGARQILAALLSGVDIKEILRCSLKHGNAPLYATVLALKQRLGRLG